MKLKYFALLPLAAFAQEMTGPTLGWSRSGDGRALQTIYGVAGAARLGPAVDWPEDLTGVTISPSGQRAVAIADGSPVLIDLVTRERTPLATGFTPDVRIWSPLGTALLLANQETGQLRIFRQQGTRFEGLDEVTFPASSYAVSDDGSSILAVAGDELLLRTSAGASIAGPKPSGFTFLARTNTPAFVDATGLVIGSNRFPLTVESALLESPAEGRLLVIDRSAGKLVWFDDQGTQLSDASCGCTIDRTERLGTAGTLRLITAEAGPAWLAETSAGSTRLFFVPPPPPPDESTAEPKNEVQQ